MDEDATEIYSSSGDYEVWTCKCGGEFETLDDLYEHMLDEDH